MDPPFLNGGDGHSENSKERGGSEKWHRNGGDSKNGGVVLRKGGG